MPNGYVPRGDSAVWAPYMVTQIYVIAGEPITPAVPSDWLYIVEMIAVTAFVNDTSVTIGTAEAADTSLWVAGEWADTPITQTYPGPYVLGPGGIIYYGTPGGVCISINGYYLPQFNSIP